LEAAERCTEFTYLGTVFGHSEKLYFRSAEKRAEKGNVFRSNEIYYFRYYWNKY
jgi:hypothetical protein